jgi:hypothetical protein
MMSLKYLAILLVFGTIYTQTTTTTPTTTNPTVNNPQGVNTCGTVGANEPKALGDCSSDKNVPNFSCCYLTFKDQLGVAKSRCDSTLTSGLVGDYKSIIKASLELYKTTFVDFQCSSSYLSVSLFILVLIALLF